MSGQSRNRTYKYVSPTKQQEQWKSVVRDRCLTRARNARQLVVEKRRALREDISYSYSSSPEPRTPDIRTYFSRLEGLVDPHILGDMPQDMQQDMVEWLQDELEADDQLREWLDFEEKQAQAQTAALASAYEEGFAHQIPCPLCLVRPVEFALGEVRCHCGLAVTARSLLQFQEAITILCNRHGQSCMETPAFLMLQSQSQSMPINVNINLPTGRNLVLVCESCGMFEACNLT
jgi:hypothetical protein